VPESEEGLRTPGGNVDISDPLAPVAAIMRQSGAGCSAEEFHAAVSVTFHQFESETYDEGQRDMWESLPLQFNLLVDDSLRSCPDFVQSISVLDVGCGTGLASDCLLRSPLGGRIREIDLLDTSSAMLDRARRRAAHWGIPVACHEGILETLPGEKRYDLIVTCSVLHHVPDLAAFLRSVRGRQAAGGLFLHLQDPNGDFLEDPDLRRRIAEVSPRRFPEWAGRLAPRRVLGRVYRELTGRQGTDCVSKTNRELLRKGVIRTPLTVAQVYAITDIHVQDGQGISIAQMCRWLPDYDLASRRSYAFFGVLRSTLSMRLRASEDELVAQRAPNGARVGAAWKLVRE
jgi:SAM-dependent methyltransferase